MFNLSVHEWDELVGVVVDQDVMGCLLIADGGGAVLLHRPGLDAATARSLGGWATERVARFTEHGPEPDGWQRRSDGGWQLWVRQVRLPSPV